MTNSIDGLPLAELRFEFLRSSGPGGQNVNKVETAVRLRFDAASSPSLSPEVKRRLLALAGSRATPGGEIVMVGRRFRARERNREDVLDRFAALLERALKAPKPRRATRPGAGARERRLDAKRRRARRKADRGSPSRET